MFVLLKNVMYTGPEWGGELLEIIEILCDYDEIFSIWELLAVLYKAIKTKCVCLVEIWHEITF